MDLQDVGAALADRLVGKFADGLALGRALDAEPQVQGPSRATLAALLTLGVLIAALGARLWPTRRSDA